MQSIKHKKYGGTRPPCLISLLLAEGHAVRALICCGICLMGAHQNFVQRAVVRLVTVMGALLNSALDALVCVAVHTSFLLLPVMVLV